MNRSLALIGLILVSLLLSPISLFAQGQQAVQTEETVWLETGDVFEILPVTPFPEVSYAWVLTEGRQFLDASQDTMYRTRFSNPGTFTLTGEATENNTGERVRTVLRIKVINPRSDAPLREEPTVTELSPLAALEPTPVTIGRVVMPPESSLLRIEPTTSNTPLQIDTNLLIDSDGDGDSSNDIDSAGSFFANGGSALYLWFVTPVTEQPIAIFTGNDSTITQDFTLFSFAEANEQQLSWVEANISVNEVGPKRYQFAVNFNGIAPPGPLLYRWKFGDGKESLLSKPIHEYRSFNSFTVSVAIVDVTIGDDVFNLSQTVHNLRPGEEPPPDDTTTGNNNDGSTTGTTGNNDSGNTGDNTDNTGTSGDNSSNQGGDDNNDTTGDNTTNGDTGNNSTDGNDPSNQGGGIGGDAIGDSLGLLGGIGAMIGGGIIARFLPLLGVFFVSVLIGIIIIWLLKKLFNRSRSKPVSKDIESMEKMIMAKHKDDTSVSTETHKSTVHTEVVTEKVQEKEVAAPAAEVVEPKEKKEEVAPSPTPEVIDEPKPATKKIPHTALGEAPVEPDPINEAKAPSWLKQGLDTVPEEEKPPIIPDTTPPPPSPAPTPTVAPPAPPPPPPPKPVPKVKPTIPPPPPPPVAEAAPPPPNIEPVMDTTPAAPAGNEPLPAWLQAASPTPDAAPPPPEPTPKVEPTIPSTPPPPPPAPVAEAAPPPPPPPPPPKPKPAPTPPTPVDNTPPASPEIVSEAKTDSVPPPPPPPPPQNEQQETLPPWLQKGLQQAAKMEQEGKVPPGFTETSTPPDTGNTPKNEPNPNVKPDTPAPTPPQGNGGENGEKKSRNNRNKRRNNQRKKQNGNGGNGHNDQSNNPPPPPQTVKKDESTTPPPPPPPAPSMDSKASTESAPKAPSGPPTPPPFVENPTPAPTPPKPTNTVSKPVEAATTIPPPPSPPPFVENPGENSAKESNAKESATQDTPPLQANEGNAAPDNDAPVGYIQVDSLNKEGEIPRLEDTSHEIKPDEGNEITPS